MKKIIAIVLILALALALAACGGGGSLVQEETETLIRAATATETAEDKGVHDATGFCVGFGRESITPAASTPLSGYGNDAFRLSQAILDDVYATCVAVRDEAGELLVFFQMDLCYLTDDFTAPARRIVQSSTGAAADHIFFVATHTHAAPSTHSAESGHWLTEAIRSVATASKEAVADLDACTGMYAGGVETDRLNFVRRYYKENGFITPNADIGTGEITAYETEADHEMRLVKFARKNQPDVVLINWQCHPTCTGGSGKTDVSSDIIGIMQKNAEKDLGIKTLYLQGGAGNINPSSRFTGEARFSEYHQIGKALGDAVAEGIGGLTEVKTGAVRAEAVTLTGIIDHSGEDRLEDAGRVYTLFSSNDRSGAATLAAQLGFDGMYEAVTMVSNSKRGATSDIDLICCAFGDVAITTAPFEMFCQTMTDVRARSPYAFTLTCGYTDGYQGYMPAKDCFANGGYEVWSCRFVQGTAEQIADTQLSMLTELKAK